MRRLITLLVVVALLAAACDGEASDTTTTTTTTNTTTSTTLSPTTTTVAPTTTTLSPTTTTTIPEPPADGRVPRALPAFAPVEPVPLLTGDPYPGPAWPGSLDGVVLPYDIGVLLDEVPEVGARLIADGFVVVPGWARLFQHAYHLFEYDNRAMFVTTDAAYHLLHLVFSNVLRETEEDTLLPELEELTIGLLEAARDQASELAGTGLADAADRVEQLFEAAAVVLDLDPGPIGALAQEEIELIDEAVAFRTSPITGFIEGSPAASAANLVDFSLFRPRGHYTRSEDLERYFRAMSLLGQESFFLNDAESLRLGILTARLFAADSGLRAAWLRIYEPTAFLVGSADDHTIPELIAILDETMSRWAAEPEMFIDLAVVEEVAHALAATRTVAINEEAAAVRIMGARFVIDSFVLDRVGFPYVGEAQPPERRRVMVSPLDLATVMGSETAMTIQVAAEEPAYLHYEEQMASLIDLFASRTDEDWAGTVYDAWLHALEPKWTEKGEEFPPFMQTVAWAAKDLMTGLGSYVELKHDTILYAKQAVIAEGGGDWIEQEPRHWVEPDPVAFARMGIVVGLLRDGLGDRDLLTDETASILDETIGVLERLERLAQDELAARPISEDDNLWLERFGSLLEALWLETSDVDPSVTDPGSTEDFDAVIADIARSSFAYLEIGTGYVDRVFVLVPTDDGRFQIAEGGVFSYYEFWRPDTDGRLTDEEWRALVRDQIAPDRLEPVVLPHPDGGERTRPAWQQAFLVDPVQ